MAGQNSRRGSGKGAKNHVVRASPTAPAGGARPGSAGRGTAKGSGGTVAGGRPGAGSGAARSASAPAGGKSNQARSQPGAKAGASSRGSSTASRLAGSGSATALPRAASAAPRSGLGRAVSAIWAPVASLGLVRSLIWLLSLFGLGASAWLTITHFDTHITLACPKTGFINCQKVTTSAQSEVFGVIPVAVLGLAFYVFMAVVNAPWFWTWSSRWQPRFQLAARRIRLGSVAVGMCFVLYLVYAELILIKNICLWCTSVHITTFLIFTLLVFYTAFAGVSDDPRPQLKA
jgi:uncharacterized membrane protein